MTTSSSPRETYNIMDRIIHNTVWVETGTYNMREHTALASA